ncbi:hypothetical protein AK812_SmicGene8594 [Symbiodinium microadriaticum]|uniref:Uncharacterized protein n=1 Tax=Symbiodinium microadriaticum TaxID=2951 RepID=A0A1Q9EKP8_SYMMI|nr:hypothetical protein AK812_SmicGene8594 [Symbiodinium microadriaticum]
MSSATKRFGFVDTPELKPFLTRDVFFARRHLPHDGWHPGQPVSFSLDLKSLENQQCSFKVAKVDSQPALVSDTDVSETTSEPPELSGVYSEALFAACSEHRVRGSHSATGMSQICFCDLLCSFAKYPPREHMLQIFAASRSPSSFSQRKPAICSTR